MDLRRVKFAYARGARVEVEIGGEWCPSGIMSESGRRRIHPDDAHLEYGPLSSAIRKRTVHIDEDGALTKDEWTAYWAGLSFAGFGGGVFYLAVDSVARDEQLMHLLFIAEALADEGL
jgi:hypothetical protein